MVEAADSIHTLLPSSLVTQGLNVVLLQQCFIVSKKYVYTVIDWFRELICHKL